MPKLVWTMENKLFFFYFVKLICFGLFVLKVVFYFH